MNWYKKAKQEMTPEELRNYEFEGAGSGHSITPKKALDYRDGKDEFETLYDISNYDDQWRLYNALGQGWSGHWGKVRPSIHLIPKIKSNQPITIYRVSNQNSIFPGAYVTESKEYAIYHGENILNGDYKLSSLEVYPDELMVYDDPHEFIYIPRSLDIAHKRL